MVEELNEEQEIIKSAIGAPIEQGNNSSAMEQSILSQEEAQAAPMAGGMTQPYQQYDQQAPADYQQYPQYASPSPYDQQATADYQQYPQTQYSSDTISEISEQVVTEKISKIKDQLERVIDFKTTVDAKIEFIEQRLQRIEKIIDRLQLSILQRVGEYVTNVEDMKKELIETQKSFKAMSDRHKLHR